MDNPEEVLQALDEFQKVRPSEIPRELEDYLCFVAKTGDPVYQWSLIKPLFREKLVRVMTDFYESCPTLDLATSPNIEHFNYDIMKCNLLELLESFANAPFTVQRICELLTSPRKEYNRVDKFMRAIEKNILVVSTKEPGPTARRSENGDSMVNGTIDDDESTPIAQTTNEVEMESWVKDCTTDANVSTSPTIVGEHDVSLIVTAAVVLPAAKITSKDLLSDDDNTSSVIHGKNELQSSVKPSDMTVSNFIAAAHEMSNTTANVTTTIPTNTPITDSSMICSDNIQNTSTNIGDSNDTASSIGIVSDVADAIINEDTSSQPSLDSESGDDSEINVAVTVTAATAIATANNKKLQTTFQPKDFVKMDDDENTKISNNKYYCENNDSQIEECKLPLLSSSSSSSASSSSSSSLINNETDINIDGEGRLSPVRQRDEAVSNSDDESKSSCDSNPESVEKRPRIECDNDITATADRIDNSLNNFTSVISTKIELNSSNDKTNIDEMDNKLPINNEQLTIDKTKTIISELSEKSSPLTSNNSITQSELLFSTTKQQNNSEFSSDSTIDSDNSKDSESVTESSEDSTSTPETSSKPIVEEPLDNDNSQKSEKQTSVIIQEAMDDDTKESNTNTMIPHPIPIIEEPKDDEIDLGNNSAVISELSVDNFSVNQIDASPILQREEDQTNESLTNIVQTINVSKVDIDISISESTIPAATSTTILTSNLLDNTEELTTDIVEHMESKTIDASESMEIDNEETMAVFHRIDDDDTGDEPMEQESGELMKS